MPVDALQDFESSYPLMSLLKIQGAHFLLQTKAEESARIIRAVIEKN